MTPVHVAGMMTPHAPITPERQDQVRVLLSTSNTVDLAMDATAIIGGLLAELDRKDAVLLRQGRNIGQMAGDNDLLRTHARQTQPIVEAGLRWFAQPDAGSEVALNAAIQDLVSELMIAATGLASDGRQN